MAKPQSPARKDRGFAFPALKLLLNFFKQVKSQSEFVEESNLLVLNKLERLLTVCKVKNIDDIDLSKEFYFIGKTDEEISLVCETNDVPENTIEREDGWRGFRIQ